MLPLRACVDELEKMGAVSTEQARRALDQLDALEQDKPGVKQVARYGITGAGAGAAFGALGNAIAKRPFAVAAGGQGVRGLAADAVKGALGAGALPLVQSGLDRRAQMGTLKRFVTQPEESNAPVAAR